MSSTDDKRAKFHVAICGGGIGGLCLAVALSKYTDIRVSVYESAERFKEIGAGVMIWTRTWKIFELMGLAGDFSRIAHAPPDGSIGVGFDYRRSDAPQEGFRFHIVEVPHGCIRFHRAQFLDVFVDHLPEGVAHFGKRLSSYSEDPSDGTVQLQFSDGSSASCDILVGCDGIRSTIRKQMFESLAACESPDYRQYIEPVWSGTTAYRGLIPVSELVDAYDGKPHRTIATPMMYCGKSKHVVSYSITQGSVVNVVTLQSQPVRDGDTYDGPWVSPCSQQELLDCYAGWEPEVESILKCIRNPTKWAIYHLRPLPFYVKGKQGKVALLGDAAHAMTPHQGAGAGQAIEDAYVLAEILGNALSTKNSLTTALRAYEHVRLPIANHVLVGSWQSGHMYEFDGPDGEDYEKLGPNIQKQWDWVWETEPDEDVLKGIEWFENELSK